MKTVIMAGGKGTRISSIADNIPKPMIRIQGKPILEIEIESLKQQGFNDFIITVSHMGNIIMDYFGNGEKWGVQIEYYYEEIPLGNAGALFKIKDKIQGDFLLLNADAIFDINFNRMYEFHNKNKAYVTLFTHPNNHPYDSGLIIADKNNLVKEWLSKEDERPQYYCNRVNAGVHILNSKIFDLVDIDESMIGTIVNGKRYKVDLDRDILKKLVCQEKVYCYDSPEYVRDMGTPERFYQVKKDFEKGIIRKKNLNNKQKAIFIDRDGTINKYKGFLKEIDDFQLEKGVSEAIKLINNSEYLAIVITNQPVVARGDVTVEQLELIHKKMQTLLGNEGSYIDAIYYCPHHPHSGYEGEIKELKIECECRKPKPGLIYMASRDYNIDITQSIMIGDSENDILAGRAAGCQQVILINKNINNTSSEEKADLVVANLLEAIKSQLK